MADKKVEKKYDKMVSYQKGYDAYFSNDNYCPHKIDGGGNVRRIAWWSGYYAARIEDKVGHILKKHGV